VLTESSIGRFDRFVPRVLLQRLALAPDVRVEQLDGTVVLVDVSGFTRLSERLARAGKEGAEQLVDAIDSCFSPLLADAYVGGGSLLKFGGDALLIWFGGEDHALRACGSAVAMRRKLRRVGRVPVGDRDVVLRMSVGIHSGAYESFLVGESHREHVIAGPAATTVVGMEALAETGQILISEATAALLPDRCLGRRRGPGVVLARAPAERFAAPAELPARPADDAVAACLSTQLRAHVASAPATPEHRLATVAFLQFGALDGLLRDRGADAAADALERTVCAVQAAADRYGICFLGSDVAAGGGKIMLSAGAPRAAGDDEERMLLALRQVVEDEPPLPVRIGVHRGSVFAGEVGPHYRRTYAVMGDTVNLAARLMAKAPPGRVYCTPGVLERSSTSFETTALDPFWVKGKAKAVQAWEVGRGRRARSAGPARPRLPLIGRDRELAAFEEALAGARAGHGALIELVGETGSGKSRLLSEARARAADMRFVHTTCEAYTQETPYGAWRDPLRQLLSLTWADADEIVLDRLRAELDATDPELLPWLPLLGIAIDADAPPTREVAELAAEYRAAKLHEVVLRLLSGALKVPTLVQIEHAHLMDDASAALLGALAMVIGTSAWVVIATRRDVPQGFAADADEHRRVELGPLSRDDALALAEASPEAEAVPPHLIAQAVERAGGSPEFLLDLLAAAAGGSVSLPDSIDAAASARIDALDAGDRTLVRRAAVLGVSFHPRRLRDVLAPEDPEPDERTWERLSSLFARDPDGHVRFKRPALREVASEAQEGGPRVNVDVDREQAGRLGVSMQSITDTLNDAFGQRQISTIYGQANQYRVILEAQPRYQQDPGSLGKLYVTGASTSTGTAATVANTAAGSTNTNITATPNTVTGSTQVPLAAFARFVNTSAPLSIAHQEQFPSVTISFDLSSGYALSDAVSVIGAAQQQIGMPSAVTGSYSGDAAEFAKSLTGEPWLILAAAIAIYIVLGVLYESFIHPLTILSTLPSAGVGALLALMLFGYDLSVIALIGIVLLMGIVKKNAILMIDFAIEAERHQGLSPEESIVQAALLRFRPIMMTTLAALFGALPLALESGTGSELRNPLGITIVGGLLLSQLLTLYTTPVIYLYMERLRARLTTPGDVRPHPAE